jgi:hypothetical protein
MAFEDEYTVKGSTLSDIDLYLKALSTLLQTLRLDLNNSIKALGAAEESIQKSLGAIKDVRKPY